MPGPIRILISSCLLGEKVRYDGAHKREAFLVKTLGRHVRWAPVCPEVECGLPVPREPMRLAGDPSSPRLVGKASGADYTERMERFTRTRLRELKELDLDGYIGKKGSPSSAVRGIGIRAAAGGPVRTGAGIFAKAFMERFPLVPVTDEAGLRDPVSRDTFLENVYTLRRFRAAAAGGMTKAKLAEFHVAHRLLLLSRGRRILGEMEKLLLRGTKTPEGDLFRRYREMLATALASRITTIGRARALRHAAGILGKALAAKERQKLEEAVSGYEAGITPLPVPVTLIRRGVRRHGVFCLAGQVFLEPDPAERWFRNLS
jgi:uncharacterized protein YbbK (DUF523 family)/uncharacterized protein YbgA (DUF1722 family)